MFFFSLSLDNPSEVWGRARGGHPCDPAEQRDRHLHQGFEERPRGQAGQDPRHCGGRHGHQGQGHPDHHPVPLLPHHHPQPRHQARCVRSQLNKAVHGVLISVSTIPCIVTSNLDPHTLVWVMRILDPYQPFSGFRWGSLKKIRPGRIFLNTWEDFCGFQWLFIEFNF